MSDEYEPEVGHRVTATRVVTGVVRDLRETRIGLEVEHHAGWIFLDRGRYAFERAADPEPEPEWTLGHVVRAACGCIMARQDNYWVPVAMQVSCGALGHRVGEWVDDIEVRRPLTVLGAPVPSEETVVEPQWRVNHVVETSCGCQWRYDGVVEDTWVCVESGERCNGDDEHTFGDFVADQKLPRPLVVRAVPVEAGEDRG